MTAASISRFAGKVMVGLLVVCAVLSMAGCNPPGGECDEI